jgi:hypothetical protein
MDSSTILFRMPYPQDKELVGSDFVTNHILPEYEFPDFSRQVRHWTADLRMVYQLADGPAQPPGNALSSIRAMPGDEVSQSDQILDGRT